MSSEAQTFKLGQLLSFSGKIKIGEDGSLDVGQGPMRVFSTYDPEELDWEGVDIVLECSGKFNARDKAAQRGPGPRYLMGDRSADIPD